MGEEPANAFLIVEVGPLAEGLIQTSETVGNPMFEDELSVPRSPKNLPERWIPRQGPSFVFPLGGLIRVEPPTVWQYDAIH